MPDLNNGKGGRVTNVRPCHWRLHSVEDIYLISGTRGYVEELQRREYILVRVHGYIPGDELSGEFRLRIQDINIAKTACWYGRLSTVNIGFDKPGLNLSVSLIQQQSRSSHTTLTVSLR